MEIWILIAAVLVPVLVTIFADDLRKLRRVLTTALDFFRDKRCKAYKWYARCEQRDLVAMLVNNPEEATPVFIESLLDSEDRVYWSTQIMGGQAFRLDVVWNYRGFWLVLGRYADDSGWTWAVGHHRHRAFESVSGRRFSRDSHWTESVLIDAATAYVDELIEETGVADYIPPRRFRVVRWLRNSPLNPKTLRREKQISES